MNDNKLTEWIERYGGIVIGVLVAIVILNFSFLYEFFKFILVIGVCAWLGNYIQRNKTKVKESLKHFIDKI